MKGQNCETKQQQGFGLYCQLDGAGLQRMPLKNAGMCVLMTRFR